MILYLTISFIILFVPIFVKVHSNPTDKVNANTIFMSFKYTTVLRAVAILMVMQQHLSGFVFGSRVFTPLGGVGVAVFLIISGWGLTISTNKKGLKGFWTKKLVRVFLPWLFVWLTMVLLNGEKKFSAPSLSALFLLDSTNWYLQYLLLCYLSFYISHKWFYHFRWLLMGGIFILSFVFWGNIQAEQSCSFLIGCLIAEKAKLFKWIVEKIKVIFIFSLFLGISLLAVKQLSIVRTLMDNVSLVDHAINMVMKTSIAISVMMLVRLFWSQINGRLAMFIGKISYELYLVHLFIVIGYCRIIGNMPLVSILVFVACSFLLSYLLYLVDNKILVLYKNGLK